MLSIYFEPRLRLSRERLAKFCVTLGPEELHPIAQLDTFPLGYSRISFICTINVSKMMSF